MKHTKTSSTEASIVLTAEETELFNRASDLQEAIAMRRAHLMEDPSIRRIWLTSETGGTPMLLMGAVADFTPSPFPTRVAHA